jgi:hypothetical protein
MTHLLRVLGHTVLHADNDLDAGALAGDRKPDLTACDVQSETFVEQLDRFLPPALRAGSLAPRGRLRCP